eukprot:15484559-Alexandrium_andersonii.AAC.1
MWHGFFFREALHCRMNQQVKYRRGSNTIAKDANALGVVGADKNWSPNRALRPRTACQLRSLSSSGSRAPRRYRSPPAKQQEPPIL